ncbi:MAG: glucosamine-6-phosphate deaminase [Eubacteriales bacterium]|nr:glucosamine-6-phosphate deaminase [Eubacteriales bacterium]
MKLIVCENYGEMSEKGAKIIAELLKAKPNCILGLATGSTPVGMYEELVKMNKAGEITFKDVTTYNLDEYYPLAPDHDQSYRYFMNHNLFNHVDIDKSRTHVPNGLAGDPAAEGEAYDKAIENAGYTDLQVLGVGQNGHIGFNEPEEELYVGTHLTALTENTIEANARFFASKDDVPTRAITMGMGSIMKARTILVLAGGKNKHFVVSKMLDDRITAFVPATLLKLHKDVILICDKAAYEG